MVSTKARSPRTSTDARKGGRKSTVAAKPRRRTAPLVLPDIDAGVKMG